MFQVFMLVYGTMFKKRYRTGVMLQVFMLVYCPVLKKTPLSGSGRSTAL